MIAVFGAYCCVDVWLFDLFWLICLFSLVWVGVVCFFTFGLYFACFGVFCLCFVIVVWFAFACLVIFGLYGGTICFVWIFWFLVGRSWLFVCLGLSFNSILLQRYLCDWLTIIGVVVVGGQLLCIGWFLLRLVWFDCELIEDLVFWWVFEFGFVFDRCLCLDFVYC